jgi:crossover junction endodeoxyribonuclease RuvC
MKKAWVGIDPGQSGCACLLTDSQVHFHSFESADQAAFKLESWAAEYQISVILEKVHSMPKQGVASTFKFGVNFGIWQGILAALNIKFQMVTPQKWKRAMLGKPMKGEDKKGKAISFARQIIPALKHVICLKKDHDKAEAFLMAYYLRNLEKGGG